MTSGQILRTELKKVEAVAKGLVETVSVDGKGFRSRREEP